MLVRLPHHYYDSTTTNAISRASNQGWFGSYQNQLSLLENCNSNLVLIGDSLIKNLKFYPNIWQKFFGIHGVINCGIGGDSTQHVLWRTNNLVFPKTLEYVFIHCGTNNIDNDEARDIS